MDPATITTLVGSVVSVVSPYVTKGAEEFAKAVGEVAFEKAKALFAALKRKFSADPEAAGTLAHFEEKPQRYQPVLEDILSEKMAQDPEFAAELERHIKGMAPLLEVVQRMKEADGVIGIQANRMAAGTARVTQEIDVAKQVTGMKIDNIG
jgi:hypothetical protein